MRPRRAHRKSRNGCLKCKARHIKCDENLPTCLNCAHSDVSCVYRNHGTATPTSSILAATLPSAHLAASVDSPASTTPDCNPSMGLESLVQHQTVNSIGTPHDASLPLNLPPSTVNMLHLELLHHMPITSKTFNRHSAKFNHAYEITVDLALRTPFLMHESLAITALHLSTIRTTQKVLYSQEAANLQAQALTIFNNLPAEYNITNPIPVFLFATLLGIHVLFDTLLFRPDDFGLFIDRFVGYLRLHRGVMIMSKDTFSLLQNSELAPILGKAQFADKQNSLAGNECAELKAHMQNADLSQASINACLEAIERLQWAFDRFNVQPKDQEGREEGEDNSELIFSWPITITAEFTELLLQRKPEALAVLAHYAVLLYWKRDMWVVGDGGRWLIESITRYLGAFWGKWLSLPLAVLQDPST